MCITQSPGGFIHTVCGDWRRGAEGGRRRGAGRAARAAGGGFRKQTRVPPHAVRLRALI